MKVRRSSLEFNWDIKLHIHQPSLTPIKIWNILKCVTIQKCSAVLQEDANWVCMCMHTCAVGIDSTGNSDLFAAINEHIHHIGLVKTAIETEVSGGAAVLSVQKALSHLYFSTNCNKLIFKELWPTLSRLQIQMLQSVFDNIQLLWIWQILRWENNSFAFVTGWIPSWVGFIYKSQLKQIDDHYRVNVPAPKVFLLFQIEP